MNRKERRRAAKRASRPAGKPAPASPTPAPMPGGGVAGALMRHATGQPAAAPPAGDPDAVLRLAAGHLQSGRPDLAAKHLQELLGEHPDDPRALQLLGVVLFQQGDGEGALELLWHVVELAPDYAEARHNLGLVLSSMGDYEAAVAAFRRTTELSPDDADVWLNLGNAERGLGRFDEAAKAFARAEKLAPEQPTAALNRAILTMETDQPERALSLFDDLLARHPDHPGAHNGRGACLAAMGRNAEGAAAHARAAELAPDNDEYRNNMREAWSRLIPAWHLPMLADAARNDAYQRTMDKHVRPGMHVLDIGSGSGLLAMMAARAGAERVTAVEMDATLADVARRIVADNGLADRIQVLNRLSQDLRVGVDLPAADLVVSEVLDAGLLGEGVLPTLRHAARQLLAPGGRMVPTGATVHGQLMALPRLRAVNPVAEICGFDLAAFDRFRNPAAYRPITLANEEHTALSAPFQIAEFDFAEPPTTARWQQATIPITATGEAHAVVFWFDLHLDDTISVSTGPHGNLSHWAQVVQFMDRGRAVTAGEEIALSMGHTDNHFHFSI
ncbi:MAG: tetratricopeptide repeat protein [Alphaproteobacteria bacterium]|nr:tetratricopeptide repeat protein [Alphaproteobacteria bacterium]MDP6816053.1 tetratricopeptide repeat protein [Alphaproteobacteria bacterium]